MRIVCFRVSPRGLSESVIYGPENAAGDGDGGGAAEDGTHMCLVECAGGFWSAVPQGRMSPTLQPPSPSPGPVPTAAVAAPVSQPGDAEGREGPGSRRDSTADVEDAAPVLPAVAAVSDRNSSASARQAREEGQRAKGVQQRATAGDTGGVEGRGEGGPGAAAAAPRLPSTYAERQWRQLQVSVSLYMPLVCLDRSTAGGIGVCLTVA